MKKSKLAIARGAMHDARHAENTLRENYRAAKMDANSFRREAMRLCAEKEAWILERSKLMKELNELIAERTAELEKEFNGASNLLDATQRQVEELEQQNAELTAELEDWWREAHDEACTNMEDCTSFGGTKQCFRPRPSILKGQSK